MEPHSGPRPRSRPQSLEQKTITHFFPTTNAARSPLRSQNNSNSHSNIHSRDSISNGNSNGNGNSHSHSTNTNGNVQGQPASSVYSNQPTNSHKISTNNTTKINRRQQQQQHHSLYKRRQRQRQRRQRQRTVGDVATFFLDVPLALCFVFLVICFVSTTMMFWLTYRSLFAVTTTTSTTSSGRISTLPENLRTHRDSNNDDDNAISKPESYVVTTMIPRSTTAPKPTPLSSSLWSDNLQHQQTKKKTLVVIIGAIRGSEIAWNTLFENLLDVNQADLALSIGEGQRNKYTQMLFNRATYVWEHKEYDDWADALDLIDGKDWRQYMVESGCVVKNLFGGAMNLKGSGAIIMMERFFLSKKLVEFGLAGDVEDGHGNHSTYDRFVITRSDHYYKCPHDLSVLSARPKQVWTPTGESYGGVTDRHLVVERENVLDALDIFPSFFRYVKSLYYTKPERKPVPFCQFREIEGQEWRMNPEGLIHHQFQQKSIAVSHFTRVMFTCAVPRDTTRWAKFSDTPVKEGVHIKYESEYVDAQRQCDRPPFQEQTQALTLTLTPSKQQFPKKCRVHFIDNRFRLCYAHPRRLNFGDSEMGPDIVKALLEERFDCQASQIPILDLVTTPRIDDEKPLLCLYSAGSIFHRFRPGERAWGMGVNPYWQTVVNPTFDGDSIRHGERGTAVYATRGSLTMKMLNEHNVFPWEGGKSPVPIRKNRIGQGHPMLLVKDLFYNHNDTSTCFSPSSTPFPPQNSTDPTTLGLLTKSQTSSEAKLSNNNTKICIVPHFHETIIVEEELSKLLQLRNQARVVSVHRPWRSVVDEIRCYCHYVASSSLNGLVIADVFGIPSLWFQYHDSDTQKFEGTFKFLDYFSTVRPKKFQRYQEQDKGNKNNDDILMVLHRFPNEKGPMQQTIPIRTVQDLFDTRLYWIPPTKSTLIRVKASLRQSFPYHMFSVTDRKVPVSVERQR